MATWIVRISPHSKTISNRHYRRFLEDGIWDKDYRNRITVGDRIGFVVDVSGSTRVEFYTVAEDLGVHERLDTWEEKYSARAVLTTTHREAVLLEKEEETHEWMEWCQANGYAPNFMPQGMMRASRVGRRE